MACSTQNIETECSVLQPGFKCQLFAYVLPYQMQTSTVITFTATVIRNLTSAYLRISLNFEIVVAKVALHPELEDGRGIVVSNARLLCVVAHTHAQMLTTPSTPDVVREFEPRQPKQNRLEYSLNGEYKRTTNDIRKPYFFFEARLTSLL